MIMKTLVARCTSEYESEVQDSNRGPNRVDPKISAVKSNLADICTLSILSC